MKVPNRRVILYSFYKKPVANSSTILARSAITEKMKASTFSNEILRRLKITSTLVDIFRTEEIITNFIGELEAMGYPLE